jgi:hypothetical protein
MMSIWVSNLHFTIDYYWHAPADILFFGCILLSYLILLQQVPLPLIVVTLQPNQRTK